HGLKEIGARLGPFDVAAIPIGAYLPPVIMKASHTTPEEALQVLADVRGRHLVPIHWGTFDLAEEPMEEPPARLLAEARRLGLGSERVWLMKHGASRSTAGITWLGGAVRSSSGSPGSSGRPGGRSPG